MEETLPRWRKVEATCGGRNGGKDTNIKKYIKMPDFHVKLSYKTTFFNYDRTMTGYPKLERRWRKDSRAFHT